MNSGQVIAGEIGSSPLGYTAIGEQVGMAQRMESVAPPGGVMLSESTARLVENVVKLGEPERVHIKGADEPVPARRLLAVGEHRPRHRIESSLVGRTWEFDTVTAILDEAVGGAGCVVTMSGPAGIGKSRLVREVVGDCRRVAASRSSPRTASRTPAISPSAQLPNYCAAQWESKGWMRSKPMPRYDAGSADADPDDVLLLEDLLGLGDATTALPDVAAEARRRRLTTLINEASLSRAEPAVYVIEDAHWIDEPSESMLAAFLAVVPQTPSLTLITYRPDYTGALSRIAGAQNLALRPLSEAHTTTLAAELLGDDPSTREVADLVRERAAGNPFFAEEIVRDLSERGLITARPATTRRLATSIDANVPATLQATIGARIDRLDPQAKHTLHAAAVIGARFDDELLGTLIDNPDLGR